MLNASWIFNPTSFDARFGDATQKNSFVISLPCVNRWAELMSVLTFPAHAHIYTGYNGQSAVKSSASGIKLDKTIC